MLAASKTNAVFWLDEHETCSEVERFRMELTALIILDTEDDLEQVADAEHIERGFDKFPLAKDETR
jgi:hypothetical protein